VPEILMIAKLFSKLNFLHSNPRRFAYLRYAVNKSLINSLESSPPSPAWISITTSLQLSPFLFMGISP